MTEFPLALHVPQEMGKHIDGEHARLLEAPPAPIMATVSVPPPLALTTGGGEDADAEARPEQAAGCEHIGEWLNPRLAIFFVNLNSIRAYCACWGWIAGIEAGRGWAHARLEHYGLVPAHLKCSTSCTCRSRAAADGRICARPMP